MNRRKLLIVTGIIAAVVAIIVVADTMVANHGPVITSLRLEPQMVLAGQTSQIICTATDRDGDELSYNWSAGDGEIVGEGSTVAWVAHNSVGFYDVTVTVTDGRGGVATKTTTIRVRTNDAPMINSLTAGEAWTLPSGSIQVTCNATDPDSDQLEYAWSATGGSFTGTGAVRNWTAPQEIGIYNITVVVSDGYGGSDTRMLPVSVVTGQPPTIEELRITKDRYEHCYLKPYSGGYYVGMKQMYDIECIVSDTSIELFYQWSYTGGVLSGEGSLVTWTAPDTSGKVAITVTVSDIAGNMASKNLVLKVVSCSVCTFGSCRG
ncbi:MAG: Ig-like domain-containing protein [Dehalococcoidia bacterium]